MNTGNQRTRKEINRLLNRFRKLKDNGFTRDEIREKLRLSKYQYYRYLKKAYPENFEESFNFQSTHRIKPLKKINKNLNPVEFCEQYLPTKPKPMQRLILKAFYNIPMNKEEKMILLNMKNAGKTTWEEGGQYTELVLIVGMKGGKTTLASLIAQIEEYELFKIGNISEYYGLTPGEEVYIINVATNKDQARDTIFAKTSASINRSPYFMARSPDLTGNNYHFRDTNVFMMSGHSNSASLVGKACKLVLLDELDRFVNNKTGKYSADEVYDALSKSTDVFNSQEHRDGKIVLISSLLHSKGFMVNQYELCKTVKSMLGFWMAEWEMQPDKYCGKTFLHKHLKIPIEHKDAYQKNPGKFLRDKASIIGYTKGAYYRMPDKIKDIFEKSHNEGYKNPIDDERRFADWFKAKEDMRYFMHHDPASNHCAYAIAIGHKENDLVIIDMIHTFLPKEEGGEVDMDEIVKFCQCIFQVFPSIEKITYDTWAAKSIMQTFKKAGYAEENLYVKISQHDSLKEEIYVGKFRCHKYDILESELTGLQQDGDRIDHPPGGSDDTADAVAAICWHCTRDSGAEASLSTSQGDADEDKVEEGFKTIESQRRHIWESEHGFWKH